MRGRRGGLGEDVLPSATLSGVLIDWDGHHTSDGAVANTRPRAMQTETMIDALRSRSPLLPIFVLSDRSTVDAVPVDVLGKVTGYVWKLEDTASFVTSRVGEARRGYLAPLLPPFFEALVRFTQEARYSWHTPGHSGGTAFLISGRFGVPRVLRREHPAQRPVGVGGRTGVADGAQRPGR